MLAARPRRSLLLVAALAAATLAVLVLCRPQLGGEFWAHGDDLALAVTWWVAVVAAAWLLVTTGACVIALGLGRPRFARFVTPVLPVGIRRLVEVAIVAACVALPALPANAATPSPSTIPVLADQPVVRAPEVPAPTPTFTTATTSTSTTTPPTAAPTRPAATAPSPAPVAPVAAPPARARVIVRSGDNLWLVARAALTRASTRQPSDTEVARYWRLVIAANRATLRSGDPSLIFPGEIVTLPPVSVLP